MHQKKENRFTNIKKEGRAELEVRVNDIQEAAADLFIHWLEGDLNCRVKPTTYESYYRSVYKYVIPFFLQENNERLTETSITGFVKTIFEDSAIADTSKVRILSIFKSALKEILKKYPRNYYLLDLIIFPRKGYEEVSVFSMKEQRLIENEVMFSKDKRALGIILCFYTGIRIGELCALRWRDIDLEAGVMIISRTVSRVKNFEAEGSKTKLQIGSTKSRKSLRKIPLPEFLIKLAKESSNDIENQDYYILSGKSTPLDPRVYQKIFKRILVKAGIQDRKFHAIRHTFATRALELGVDIKTLSEILGHSSITITLNIYTHSLIEQKKIAMEKFNDMHARACQKA